MLVWRSSPQVYIPIFLRAAILLLNLNDIEQAAQARSATPQFDIAQLRLAVARLPHPTYDFFAWGEVIYVLKSGCGLEWRKETQEVHSVVGGDAERFSVAITVED